MEDAVGYLAYVLAVLSLLFRDTHGMTFNQSIKVILDTAGSINGFFFIAALVVLGIMVLIAIVSALAGSGGGVTVGGGLALMVVIFTIGQGIILFLNVAMAESWGSEGITDPTRFIVALVVTLLIGLS